MFNFCLASTDKYKIYRASLYRKESQLEETGEIEGTENISWYEAYETAKIKAQEYCKELNDMDEKIDYWVCEDKGFYILITSNDYDGFQYLYFTVGL
jgi:hypothetical protein